MITENPSSVSLENRQNLFSGHSALLKPLGTETLEILEPHPQARRAGNLHKSTVFYIRNAGEKMPHTSISIKIDGDDCVLEIDKNQGEIVNRARVNGTHVDLEIGGQIQRFNLGGLQIRPNETGTQYSFDMEPNVDNIIDPLSPSSKGVSNDSSAIMPSSIGYETMVFLVETSANIRNPEKHLPYPSILRLGQIFDELSPTTPVQD